MIYSTSPSIQGKRILDYHGLVSGSAAVSQGTTRSVAQGDSSLITDTRNKAIEQMSVQATNMGANAIIGIVIDHGGVVHSLMVSAYGTAVTVD